VWYNVCRINTTHQCPAGEKNKMTTDGLRFFAHGRGTEIPRQRATDFWNMRCPNDIVLLVLSDEIFDTWQSGRHKDTVGTAYIKRRLIVVPLRTLKEPRWGLYLEHELLHLEHPNWDEGWVVIESYDRPFAISPGFS